MMAAEWKFVKELKFAQIKRKKWIDGGLAGVFRKAYSLNKNIFGRTPKKFDIFVCDNEADIKKKARRFYQKWGTAYATKRSLVTRSPEFVEKIGRWKRKDFQNIMNHEMNHVFYQSIYGSWKPIWLAEGLACCVGRNFILNKKELRKIIDEYRVGYRILEHRYLRIKFRHGHFPRYPVWANFTKYIIKKHSLKKLTAFLDRYSKKPNRANYDRLFKKVFGLSERKLFREFLSLVGPDCGHS